jgi:hypothetical protein
MSVQFNPDNVEYRVRPVVRYIVTRWESGVTTSDDPQKSGASFGGCETRWEFENADTAYDVAYALCKAEHDASGEGLDSAKFTYPKHPAMPAA